MTAKSGAVVTVCLPVNSGTGYSWRIQIGGDAELLDAKSSIESTGPQPGAPATTRFTLKAPAPGDYMLIFMLLPPGDIGAEAGRVIFSLRVV